MAGGALPPPRTHAASAIATHASARSANADRSAASSLAAAVPHMPGGTKYQRYPDNGFGPGPEINRIPSWLQ